MTIYMFSGNPGTGKTYHIVKEVILPELQSAKPRHIYHNIRLKTEVIECELLRPFALAKIVHPVTPEWFLTIYNHMEELKGALIIIDEVQNVFNSSKAMSDLKLVEFFTTHRHHCIDIVLGTQENSNINKVVRSLIEVDNRFYKLKDKTGLNAYRVETWYKDDKKASGSKKRFYDPEYFKFYSSYVQGAVSAGLVETPVIPKNNLVKFYFLLAGLAVLGVMYAGYKVYYSLSHKAEKFEASGKSTEKINIPQPTSKSLDTPASDRGTQNDESVSSSTSDDLEEEIKVPLYSGGYRTITNSFRVSGLVRLGLKYIYTLHIINSEVEDGVNENFRVVQFEMKWEVGDIVKLNTLKASRMGSNPNFKSDTDASVVASSRYPENVSMGRSTGSSPLYVEGVSSTLPVHDSQSVDLSSVPASVEAPQTATTFKAFPPPGLGVVSSRGSSPSMFNR